MALYKYFKKASSLPDPEGPLSAEMPSSSILAANKELEGVKESSNTGKKRGQYKHYTASEKAKVAKRATECGVTNTVRYFAQKFADRPLSEGTIRSYLGKTIQT